MAKIVASFGVLSRAVRGSCDPRFTQPEGAMKWMIPICNPDGTDSTDLLILQAHDDRYFLWDKELVKADMLPAYTFREAQHAVEFALRIADKWAPPELAAARRKKRERWAKYLVD